MLTGKTFQGERPRASQGKGATEFLLHYLRHQDLPTTSRTSYACRYNNRSAKESSSVRDGVWYMSMAAMILRCTLFTAAMSIIGVSAAAIGRSTTAAVIGIVMYFVLIEYTAVKAAPSFARWLLYRCHLVDRA